MSGLSAAGRLYTPFGLAQERRDVEIVVGDLERRALPVVHADVAVAAARAGLLAGRARPRAAVVEARGDHGDADVVAERRVDDRAEDDVRLRVGGRVDQLGGLVDLEQAEVVAAGDVEQDAGGALDGLLQQRAGDRGLGGLGRARLAATRCRCPSAPSRRPA